MSNALWVCSTPFVFACTLVVRPVKLRKRIYVIGRGRPAVVLFC